MKMPDRNMINQQHTWAVAPGTFGFCPGGTDHRSRDRRTVGSLEVFWLRMAFPPDASILSRREGQTEGFPR
jgi:hypothetical protein